MASKLTKTLWVKFERAEDRWLRQRAAAYRASVAWVIRKCVTDAMVADLSQVQAQEPRRG